MDINFSKEQQEFRKAVAKVCKDEIAPAAAKLDAGAATAADYMKKIAESGFLGLLIPVEYGGHGADLVTMAVCAEELAAASASAAGAAVISGVTAALPIVKFGSEDMKKKILPGIASGELMGAFAITEAESGSDIGSIAAAAEKKNGGYILNGAKAYVSNGPDAGAIVVFARTGEPGPKGISAFLVEKGAPGLAAGEPLKTLSLRGMKMSEIRLTNCAAPAGSLIGAENGGFKVALETFEHSRLGMAAISIGILRAAMELAIDYAETRKVGGKLIGAYQEINEKIADMRMNLEVGRQLLYYAAWMKQTGKPCAVEIASAKLFASEVAERGASAALHVFGGAGLISGAPIERVFRDSKICEVADGTSEIMRQIIAADVLKD